MPRVKVDIEKWKAEQLEDRLEDFSLYVIKLKREKKITNAEIGEWLGITRQDVSYKLTHNTFSLKDILVIFREAETPSYEIKKLLCWEE